jgi:hypothetical protein
MTKDEHDHTLTVTVYAPRAVEPKTFTWNKTTKVGDAAKEAAEAFGYTAGTPTLQKGQDVLDRNKPLVAEKVHDGDRLELVDAGGGV